MKDELAKACHGLISGEGMAQDHMKPLMIQQGYVPSKCTLHGSVIWGLINRSEDPCLGCNEDRTVCKGRSADDSYMEKARLKIDLENKVLLDTE